MEARKKSSIGHFLRWYNNKDVVPTLEAMQKKIVFYHNKDTDMLKLGCTFKTWPTFVYTKPAMQNSIPSQREIKTYCKESEKMSLVVPLSFLHAKQLVMKFFSESLQTYADLSLGFLPANYIPNRCVNPCPPVFIRVGISIQKPVDSHLDRTRPVALKILSCLIFNQQDLIVKLTDSTLHADGRKLTA